MPSEIGGLELLQFRLFRENFFEVLDALPQQETQIMIPQMSAVTNNLELIPFLKLLGIVSVFNPKWNITEMGKSKSNVYVESIKQSAFFSTSFTALNSIGTIATRYASSEYNIICIIWYECCSKKKNRVICFFRCALDLGEKGYSSKARYAREARIQ